ncbi:DUF2585 family protein [Tianweitania sp.]|uniref:DUF2585 family protein n=1 Tax=Tianweitania sp. TaxID=2021634 RepID=UPI002899ABAE|nr:DUF2585 family protein [Tianweitania sp.]
MTSHDLASAAPPAGRVKFIPRPAPVLVYVATVLAILAAKAAILYWMGNDVTCACGVKLWLNDATGPENSKQIADWYSLSHLIAGMLFAAVMWWTSRRWPLGWMIVAAAAFSMGWEVVENTPWIIAHFGESEIGANYAGDTIVNSLGDSVFVLLGFVAALRLPLFVVIALGLLAEAAVTFAINDGLILSTMRFVGGLF